MARQLRTYQTSMGFFDLAVAAPSMKAALEAWGASGNLFQQGFAAESHDPAIIEAALAKPGVVLKRPVGSSGPFKEHADRPKAISIEQTEQRLAQPEKKAKAEPKAAVRPDREQSKKAALAFERESAAGGRAA